MFMSVVVIRVRAVMSMSLSSTSPLALTFPGWRHLWRKRGLVLDSLLPCAFAVPMATEESMRKRVSTTVLVPRDKTRTSVRNEDAELVLREANWVVGFVVESLPAQIVTADVKPMLPGVASALAVQSIHGETEFLGSFDLLIKLHATKNAEWKKYHGQEGVVDVKLSGSSQPFGLSSTTMRRHLLKGREVLKAAKKDRCRVGRCAFVAYLLRRPPGPVFTGREKFHKGGWAFVAYDAQKLMGWVPGASNCPRPFLFCSDLLVEGSQLEPEAVHAPAASADACPDRSLGPCREACPAVLGRRPVVRGCFRVEKER